MPSTYTIAPLDLSRLRTCSLHDRPSKVHVRQFARPWRPGGGLQEFLGRLPRILAAADLRALVEHVVRARRQRRAILWGIGGHVIKVGLGPVLGDLIARGFVTGLAMNGAALIHDVEVALVGHTSEDVAARLGRGRFGMAEETGRLFNQMAERAVREGIGLGEAAGRVLAEQRPLFARVSVILAAQRHRVPLTVHLALGTDTPHLHPTADGSALGQASLHDFRLFCALVQRMQPEGVYLNWGSAVLLPEVFLKAVSAVRNLGTRLEPITTANFDFLQHYRGLQNVVRRPTAGGRSRGYALTGHHELLLPLFAAALVEAERQRRRKAS
jgi:hypothetical protein